MLCFAASLPAQSKDAPAALKKCWEYSIAGLNERGIAAGGGSVYLSGHDGRVEAVSADTGKRLWFSDLGGETISNIAVDEEAVFVVTRSADAGSEHPKPVLRSLSKTTGITNWAAAIPDAESVYLGLSKSDLVVVSTTGVITSVSAANGSPRWTTNLNAKVSVNPDFSPDSIIVAAETKEVIMVSADTGTIGFRKKNAFRPTAVLLIADEKGAWGDERGNLYFFSTKTQKKIWKIKQGAAVSDLVDLGEMLLAVSNDNFAYLIALYNGNVRWKKRQPERVFRPAVLSGQLIVLSARSGSSSIVIEKDHGKAVDNIPTGAGEALVQAPVAAGGTVVLASGNGISAYSAGRCVEK